MNLLFVINVKDDANVNNDDIVEGVTLSHIRKLDTV